MNTIFVRGVRQSEEQMLVDWATENAEKNGFDPAVLYFPTTYTLCAYDKEGPVAFLPVQTPFMMESFAPRPGIGKLQSAAAFKELTQYLVSQAHLRGVGEIYFLGSDKDTNDFATGQIFEELPYRVYRAKLKDLEQCSTQK